MSEKVSSASRRSNDEDGKTYDAQHHPPSSSRQVVVNDSSDDVNDNEEEAEAEEGIIESQIAPEIGGFYGPLMRIQYSRQVENSATVPLPPRAIGGLKDQVEYDQTRSCRCSNSNCLKLYCECFAGGMYCTAYCNCTGCNNYFDGDILSKRRLDRVEAIKACLDRNQHSFRPTGVKHYGNPLPPTKRGEYKYNEDEDYYEEEDEMTFMMKGTFAATARGGLPPPRHLVPPSTSTTTAKAAAAPASKPTNNNAAIIPCSCSKSRCLKKYCECFRRDDYCNSSCKCNHCMNLPGNPNRILASRKSKTAKGGGGGGGKAGTTSAYAQVAAASKKLSNATTAAATIPGKRQVPPDYSNAVERKGGGGGAKRNKNTSSNIRNIRSDVTYPPSYYALPMTLPTGEVSATLGFGQGLTLNKKQGKGGKTTATSSTSFTKAGGRRGITNAPAPQQQSAFDRAMTTEDAVLARRKVAEVHIDDDANNDAKKASTNNNTTSTNNNDDDEGKQQKGRKFRSLQKQMEQHWNEETRDVLGTFQAMRQELLQRKQDAGLLGVDIVLSREYSYYDLVGGAQLSSVELELADIVSCIQEGEVKAKELLSKDAGAKEGERNNEISISERAAAAAAEQQGPPTKARNMSDGQRAQIITEAVQDTAMMKELARIIRRRALEMSERL